MEQIDGYETSACKNQRPGIYLKDYTQYPKHGESLKSRIKHLLGQTLKGRVSNPVPKAEVLS
jgi:hypothetical protein